MTLPAVQRAARHSGHRLGGLRGVLQEANQKRSQAGQRSNAAAAYVLDPEGRMIAELKQLARQPQEVDQSQTQKRAAQPEQQLHEDEQPQAQERPPQPHEPEQPRSGTSRAWICARRPARRAVRRARAVSSTKCAGSMQGPMRMVRRLRHHRS
jgi:hypothetical protein